MRKILLLLLLLLLPALPRATGQPGAADSFDPNADGNVYALAVQADGRVLLAGDFVTVGGVSRPAGVARVLPDGAVDPTFAPAIAGGTAQVFAVAALPDGRVLLAGSFHGVGPYPIHRLARLLPDGTPDPTFSAEPDSHVRAIVPLPDGRLVVLGSFTTLNGGATAREHVARLHADGSVDPTFNPPPNSGFSTLAVQPDGRVLLGGFGQVAGTPRSVVRLLADGSLDPTFAEPGADSVVLALLPQPDGRVVVAGQFTAIGGVSRAGLARLQADGTRDATFTALPGIGAILHALSLQANGSLLVGGDFVLLNSAPRLRLARVSASGGLEAGFDPASGAVIWGSVLQSDGRQVVAGAFQHELPPPTLIGGAERNRVARLRNDPANLAIEVPDTGTLVCRPGGSAPVASWLRFELSVDGGASWSVLGPAVRTADGWQLSGLSLPLTGRVRALGVVPVPHQGGVSSSLTVSTRSYQFAPAAEVVTLAPAGVGATSALLQASVDANGSATSVHFEYGRTTAYGSAVPAALSPNDSSSPLTIGALAAGLTPHVEYHCRVVAANSSGVSYGEDVTFIANATPAAPALSVASLEENNPPGQLIGLLGPTVDADGDPVTYTLVSGPGDTDNASFYLSGAELRAVGTFNYEFQPSCSVRVRASDGFANGTSEAALTVTIVNQVEPPLVTTLPATAVRHSSAALRAQLNPNSNFTSAQFEWGPTDSYGQSVPVFFFPADDNAVHALEVFVGGLTPGTTYHYRLTATNAEGAAVGADQTFTTRSTGPGDVELAFAPDIQGGEVLCVAVQPDGKIVLGGFFTHVNGVPRQNLARLLPDGSLDLAFDPAPDNVVQGLAVDLNALYVGGSFASIGGQARTGLARLGFGGSVDATFVPSLNGPVEGLALGRVDGFAPVEPVVWGGFTQASGLPRAGLARLGSDGAVATSLPDLAPDGPVYCVLVHPSGDLLIGGAFTALGGAARAGFAAISPTGMLRSGYSFAAPGALVTTVGLSRQGIVVGGSFTALAGGPQRNLARLLDDGFGTLDATFIAPTDGPVLGVAAQADGSLLVAGGFTQINGAAPAALARVTATGATDASFDAGVRTFFSLPPTVRSVHLQPDGRVLATGQFGYLGGEARAGFARLANTAATRTLSVPFVAFTPFAYWTVRWQFGGSAPFLSEAHYSWSQPSLAFGLGQSARTGPDFELTGPLPLTGGSAGGHPITYTGTILAGGRAGGSSSVCVRQELAYPPGGLADWRLLHFGTTTPAGDAADEADPDGDGCPNLLEFVLGTPPTLAGSSPMPEPVVLADGLGGQRLHLRFVERAGLSGVSVGAEWSPGLGAGAVWTPVPDAGTPPGHDFSVPVVPGGRGYLRLRVSRSP
ncbi:MAG: hypothetical protein JSR82_03585 [Verrucomicrobia bacterium]|nr:hypothetical protein [Verrucomicrobiota bacterium]